MNRRTFLKGIAAAFVVPEVIVPERKVWALDQTMIQTVKYPVHPDPHWNLHDYVSPAKEFTHITFGDYTITEGEDYNYYLTQKPSGQFTLKMQEPEGGFAKLPRQDPLEWVSDVTTWERDYETLKRKIRNDLNTYLFYGPEGRE
jgi:hypothetical protein